MRNLVIALLLAICLPMATAVADGRAFPPDNCSVSSPFMAFTAIDGSNTYCTNGQGVLSNALPSCGADQVVAFNGSAFYCKPSEFNVPACAPGEFLTSDNGSSFSCVPKSADIPTCAANEFLTYNGIDFKCAATSGGGGETSIWDGTGQIPVGSYIMTYWHGKTDGVSWGNIGTVINAASSTIHISTIDAYGNSGAPTTINYGIWRTMGNGGGGDNFSATLYQRIQ